MQEPVFFTTQEVALASRLPVSGVEHLVKARIAPESFGGGRGAARRYPTQSLAHFAIIGAFYQAGLDIVAAARLATALYEEAALMKGFFPDSLDNQAVLIEGSLLPTAVRPDGYADRYLLQKAIEANCPDWKPYEAQSSDVIIEVIDRSYVIWGNERWRHAKFRLDGWQRGASEIAVVLLHKDAGVNYQTDFDTEEGEKQARKKIDEVEAQFEDAKRRAVSILMVNASLAVRRAFKDAETVRSQNKAVRDDPASPRSAAKPENSEIASQPAGGEPQ